MSRVERRTVLGHIAATSPVFSRAWDLTTDGQVLARARRRVWRRVSEVMLADGSEWLIEPAGWGRLVIREGDTILAEATREGAFGRRFELTGPDFGIDLHARSMSRRRWNLEVGGSPIGELRGGLVSFNRMAISLEFPVPLAAILLAWHIVVRAWEAAAAAAS